MNLTDAITAVESAISTRDKAVAQTGADQATRDQIATKLEAAEAVVKADVLAENEAGKAQNAALKALIDAATAAMVPVDEPAPATT